MKLETLKWILVAFVAILLWKPPAFANTIGFSYSQAVDDHSWGVHGDYEAQVADAVNFGAEGQLQSGDVYLGNLDLSVTLFDNIRLESNNTLKGYELDTIGRSNDLGASLVLPIGSLEISAGVFGKNGNPFQPVYELENPNDPNSAVLKDAGITIKDGSSLNLALRTEFDVSKFEVGLRGLFEVLGEGDKVHQLTADIETGGQLIGGLNWTVQGQVVAQAYGDLIQWERSVISSVEYPF